MQKRCVAINDLSCFGRCSLTVALPMLSAAGIETCALPTAILSTHTGGFTDYTFRDLTADVGPICDHWASLGLAFDALYSGYLGSFAQLELVGRMFDVFKTDDNIIMVDPVMGDNGRLYPPFEPPFARGMAELCAKADVVVPNITEAALMTGREYCHGPHSEGYISGLLTGLRDITDADIVLTGVWFDDEHLGAACMTGSDLSYVMGRRVEGFYHGTGDVFASALLAALVNGASLERAARVAVDFTVAGIRRSKDMGVDTRFGVPFELILPQLIDAVAPDSSF